MILDLTQKQAQELLEDIYTAYDEGKLSTSNEVINRLIEIAPPEYPGLWQRLMSEPLEQQ